MQRRLHDRIHGEMIDSFDEELERTYIAEAPWWIVEAVDKKRARLNCITHLLGQILYQPVHHEPVVLPPRVHNPDYHAARSRRKCTFRRFIRSRASLLGRPMLPREGPS
jgi:hypothetical protein